MTEQSDENTAVTAVASIEGALSERFRIKSPLRCDGIGRLDCAEDLESGARMAVRWLPLEANGDAAVRACARLPEHPTLPRIRQTGALGDKAFLAMDFPDGRLLSTMMGEPLPVEQLQRIGAQLADALHTIHQQGVFHGELSAESVLVVSSGTAYLWDMPLVIANRLADRRGEERLMHQLVRTAPFLAPERARGSGASAQSDVYSLAALMCLAGGAPLPMVSTTLAAVHAIATGHWSPQVPTSFAAPVQQLLHRMLLPNELSRPSAREVADALASPNTFSTTLPELAALRLPRDFVTAAPGHGWVEAAAAKVAAELPTAPRPAPMTRELPDEAPTAPRVPVLYAEEAPPQKGTMPLPPLGRALMVSSPISQARAVRPPPPPPLDQVALTDSLQVDSELARGAITMSAAEAATAAELLARRRRTALLTRGVVALAVVVGVLLGATIFLAQAPASHNGTVPPPPPLNLGQPPAALAVEVVDDGVADELTGGEQPVDGVQATAAPETSPAPPAGPADDELLPSLPPNAHPPAPRPASRARPQRRAPQRAEPLPAADSSKLLEGQTAAPEEAGDLKRPQF